MRTYADALGFPGTVYRFRNSLAVIMRTYSDALGRTTRTIENFQGTGAVTETTSSDRNRTTLCVFDSGGRLAYLSALNPKGAGNGVEEQKTYYECKSLVNGSWTTAVAYPDSSDSINCESSSGNVVTITTSGSDHVSTTFDLAGRPTSRTDQRGTVHQYAYDSAGRLEKDMVTTAGGDTDTAVLGIKFTYDALGRRTKVGSYDNAACTGTPVNEVAWAYDGDTAGDLGWGGVLSSRQQHGGATDGNSPHVDYAYTDGATSTAAKYVRLASVTYPGTGSAARTVYYNYPSDAGIGDHLSRLDNLADTSNGTTKYAQYTYIGSGTIVQVDHPAVGNNFALTYKGVPDQYPGFDRFGRVVWQKWTGNGPEGVVDRYFYGYDRGSNRLWRAERAVLQNIQPATDRGRDEGYVYDGLDRLKRAQRGTLTGTRSSSMPYAAYDSDFNLDGRVNTSDLSIVYFAWGYGHEWAWGDNDGDGDVDAADEAESLNVVYNQQPTRLVTHDWLWNLDSLGNWGGYNVTTSAGTLNQTRTHNAANEITAISPANPWINPTYDLAGNMTSGPKPSDEANRIHLKFDAWNRMTEVRSDNGGNPGDLILTARYDGLGRRISKDTPTELTDYYYNESWQVLEEQKTAHARYAILHTYAQYLWDIRYIDAPVLRWRDRNSDGTLDETLYYCNDANMNVTALVDTSGSVVERYQYTPYGSVTVCDSAWTPRQGNVSDYDNCILYCGYRFDWETGLYDVRNRIYHPTMGRWVQRDPAGYVDDVNLHGYVSCRVLGSLDPYGLKKTCVREGPPVFGAGYLLGIVPNSAKASEAGGNGMALAPPAYILVRPYRQLWRCCEGEPWETTWIWGDLRHQYYVDYRTTPVFPVVRAEFVNVINLLALLFKLKDEIPVFEIAGPWAFIKAYEGNLPRAKPDMPREEAWKYNKSGNLPPSGYEEGDKIQPPNAIKPPMEPFPEPPKRPEVLDI
jgi:RHS repeat-associated protein